MARIKVELEAVKEKIQTVVHGNMTWVDIMPPTPAGMKYLAERFHFQPLALEDCLSHRQIPKVDDFSSYLFFVFHYNRYDKKTRISVKRQWSAFIGDNFIVTVHTGELKALAEIFRECQAGQQAREEYLTRGSGYLLFRIIDRAIDSYFPVMDKILSLLEKTEDSVFDEEADATAEVSILRRDIITQRMVMFPTRTLLLEMRNKLKRYTSIDIELYYDNLIDHMNKICQTLDEAQEIVEVFKDTDYTLISHRVNHVLRILNIFAAIILPFLAISGIFGMNVFLPGGIEKGGLVTFIVLICIMAAISGGMLYFFHRKKWI